MSAQHRTSPFSRRELLACAGAGAVLLTGMASEPGSAVAAEPSASNAEPFGYCLNTATIHGQKLSLVEEMEVAAKAGYQGFEPWVREIQEYVDHGGSTGDLKKRAVDLGLSIESAIGFADWVNDDDAKRAQGLEQWKRDAALVAAIGGKRMAAPLVGAYKTPVELPKVADRYRKLLGLSRSLGVVPQLEMWGGSKTMARLGEVAYVLVESAQPDACVLIDAFQVYRGGSDFAGLRLFNGATLHVFHINDYPADPPRDKVTDAHRVYPGDGICPLTTMFRDLHAAGFRGMFSLELFNREYWKRDALTTARTGLEKIRAAVRKAMG